MPAQFQRNANVHNVQNMEYFVQIRPADTHVRSEAASNADEWAHAVLGCAVGPPVVRRLRYAHTAQLVRLPGGAVMAAALERANSEVGRTFPRSCRRIPEKLPQRTMSRRKLGANIGRSGPAFDRAWPNTGRCGRLTLATRWPKFGHVLVECAQHWARVGLNLAHISLESANTPRIWGLWGAGATDRLLGAFSGVKFTCRLFRFSQS